MTDLFDNIYFSFYTFGSINAAVFSLSAGMFMLAVKNKSRATLCLGLMCLFNSLQNMGYVLAATWYHPLAAYHRWITVGSVLPTAIYLAQFFFYFPGKRAAKTARALLAAQWLVAMSILGVFIIASLGARTVFIANCHFWDFNLDRLSHIIALVIVIYIGIVIAAGTWRFIVTPGRYRLFIVSILAAMLLMTLVPAIANMLSRSGAMERGTFQTIWSLMTIAGIFFVLIIYSNISTDAMSVMGRIIGVSLVFLLVLMQLLAYVMIRDREQAYDQVHRAESLLALSDPLRASDLRYISAYPRGGAEQRMLYSAADVGPDLPGLKRGMMEIPASDVRDGGGPGHRQYREGEVTRAHYVTYPFTLKDTGGFYEAGFSYREYREFIHVHVVKLVFMVLMIIVVMGAGYPLFFIDSLVRPLSSLVSGMKAVGKGDLTVRLRVLVEDEIGYLTRSFNLMATALHSSKHERDTAVKLLRNAHARLEERVKERTRELNEANKELKKFAYIVSHDLRAPLINIRGFASELGGALEKLRTLAADPPGTGGNPEREKALAEFDAEIAESLRFINMAVTRMDGLINAILKLSRLGRRELKVEAMDLSGIAEGIIGSLEHQIKEKGIEMELAKLPALESDRISMEQVLGNLIDNAVKYLDPGRRGRITVSGEESEGWVTIRVSDNGRGIAAEDIPRAFELFRRVGRQDVPGEGMGLAYVQALLKRLGGRIWCESSPGVGSTFCFSVPATMMEVT
ncbi:MAG: HAMP domain-containing protein [Spirochaetes bacterium]|nr:HAMP domain-containing protein [Spirochaetota bacterium]